MNGDPSKWVPSRRALAVEWYLRLVTRYAIAPSMIGWELIADKAHNPLVLMIAAMLYTSTDVVGLVRGLIRQARAERKELEDLLAEREQQEREHE